MDTHQQTPITNCLPMHKAPRYDLPFTALPTTPRRRQNVILPEYPLCINKTHGIQPPTDHFIQHPIQGIEAFRTDVCAMSLGLFHCRYPPTAV